MNGELRDIADKVGRVSNGAIKTFKLYSFGEPKPGLVFRGETQTGVRIVTLTYNSSNNVIAIIRLGTNKDSLYLPIQDELKYQVPKHLQNMLRPITKEGFIEFEVRNKNDLSGFVRNLSQAIIDLDKFGNKLITMEG